MDWFLYDNSLRHDRVHGGINLKSVKHVFAYEAILWVKCLKSFSCGNYLFKVYSKLTEATCVGTTYFIIVDFELMLIKFRFFDY